MRMEALKFCVTYDILSTDNCDKATIEPARHFPGEPFECPDKEQAARLYAMGLAKFLPPVGISRK